MTNPAKELLQGHNSMLSREAILTARIATLKQSLKENIEDTNEMIESMVFGNPNDGMPRSHNHGSQTEYVAHHYEDEMKHGLDEMRSAIARACTDLWKVQNDLAVYGAVLLSLTCIERSFVHLHYDEGHSMNKIAGMDLGKDGKDIYSAKTISRLNRTLLAKINAALRSGSFEPLYGKSAD